MGSIYYINRNPHQWKVWESDKVLKPLYGSERLLNVVYGEYDDYPSGVCELEMYMRPSIYNKLLSGEYTVDPESTNRRSLIIRDKNNNEIKPLASIVY